MKFKVPEPLPIDWVRKSPETARSGIEILSDGRIYCWIEHEIVHGVTPEMLVWWFKNLEGEVGINGQRYNRYRAWHPRDHLFAEYAKRNEDGSVGVGSVIHLAEMLDADPKYLVHVFTEIKKLDETGYEHHPKTHGFTFAKLKYEFERVPGGTRYHNSLTVGLPGLPGRLVNGLIRRFIFDQAHGEAWLKHNIEEVGNFESFLPRLFAAENPARVSFA